MLFPVICFAYWLGTKLQHNGADSTWGASVRLVHEVLVRSELSKATTRVAGIDSLPSAQLPCSESRRVANVP